MVRRKRPYVPKVKGNASEKIHAVHYDPFTHTGAKMIPSCSSMIWFHIANLEQDAMSAPKGASTVIRRVQAA